MKFLTVLSLIISSVFVNAAELIEGDYTLDKSHAHIGFNISHLGISLVYGRFNKFDGRARLNLNGKSSVNFTVQASSIDTNFKKRDDHLRNEDFFDVETFEMIIFNSTQVELTNAQISKITGDLTIKGVTKPVVFDVKTIGAVEARGKQKAGFSATTKINRSEFDMPGFTTIGEEVAITVSIEIEKVN